MVKRVKMVERMNMVDMVYIVKMVYMVKRSNRVKRVKRVNRVKRECVSTLSREDRALSGPGAAWGSLSQLSILTTNIKVDYSGNILHPVITLHLVEYGVKYLTIHSERFLL